jgi:perosamine synthetase
VIRVSQPVFLGNEATYVADALAKGQLSQGEYVLRFEEAFAKFCSAKYAVSCNSGTAALHLSMLALGVKPGDAVLMPALSYVATANAVAYCGGYPVFVDIDSKTWAIDVSKIEEALLNAKVSGLKPVGILPVHLFGVSADMHELNSIAKKHDLWLVEDAAQAHGMLYRGCAPGSFSKTACYSFYANKILACGEGGMLTTDDELIADLAQLYRGQGQHPADARYFHRVVGYNYRMTELSAAIGLGQLECYPEHVRRRKIVVEEYQRLIDENLPRQERPQDSADWMFAVLVPSEDRDDIAEKLLIRGVETRPVFPPLSTLPPHLERFVPPVSYEISHRGICLPTHAGMSEIDVRYVVDSLKSVGPSPYYTAVERFGMVARGEW